jgi:hypothetical protein
MEQDSEGGNVIVVLLTENPVASELLDGETFLEPLLGGERGRGICFRIDTGNEASLWRISHPSLPDGYGCGFCSNLRVKVAERTKTGIEGTAFTAEPDSWEDLKYEFKIDFKAGISIPEAYRLPSNTPERVAAARRELRQKGFGFTAGGFLSSVVFPDVVGLYLDAGMDPNTVEQGTGMTALLRTLQMRCELPDVQEVIRLLVKAGADVNHRAKDGSSPLLEAYGCADMLEVLLDAGARLDAPSRIEGETVGQTVMRQALTFQKPGVPRLLIERGFDVKAYGAGLLDKARGDSELVELLRKAGAPLGWADKPTFSVTDKVLVRFAGLPGHQGDWITVIEADQPPEEWGRWFYTEGKKEGKHYYDPLPPGSYEVRVYFDWPNGSFDVKSRHAFTVK